jgi:hypothetical protein
LWRYRVRLVTEKMEYNPETIGVLKAINPEKNSPLVVLSSV